MGSNCSSSRPSHACYFFVIDSDIISQVWFEDRISVLTVAVPVHCLCIYPLYHIQTYKKDKQNVLCQFRTFWLMKWYPYSCKSIVEFSKSNRKAMKGTGAIKSQNPLLIATWEINKNYK